MKLVGSERTGQNSIIKRITILILLILNTQLESQ